MSKAVEDVKAEAGAKVDDWLLQYWAPAANDWITRGRFGSYAEAHRKSCDEQPGQSYGLPNSFLRVACDQMRVVPASEAEPCPYDRRIKALIADAELRRRQEGRARELSAKAMRVPGGAPSLSSDPDIKNLYERTVELGRRIAALEAAVKPQTTDEGPKSALGRMWVLIATANAMGIIAFILAIAK